MDSNESYYKSCHEGSEWIKRNIETFSKFTVEYEIVRWDHYLSRLDYRESYNKIIREFCENTRYRHAILSTIDTFAERKSIEKESQEYASSFYKSLFYILEECPVIMPMWAKDKVDFIIYPKPMTAAMETTRNYILDNELNHYVNWISLRFKKKSESTVESKKTLSET